MIVKAPKKSDHIFQTGVIWIKGPHLVNPYGHFLLEKIIKINKVAY